MQFVSLRTPPSLASRRARIAAGGAALLAISVAFAPARAETAAAPSDDCLAKPDAASPRGSHWFYHVDHASGRKCWHLRGPDDSVGDAETAKPSDTAKVSDSAMRRPTATRAAATAPVEVPAAPRAAPSAPPADTAGNMNNDSRQGVAPPAAAGAAIAWPAAPVQSSQPAQIVDAASAPVPSQPAVDPDNDVAAPSASSQVAPPSFSAAAPAPIVDHSVAPADTSFIDAAHMPALLGIGFAIALIVLGSLAVRWVARLMRRPRRPALIDLPDDDEWPEPIAPAAPAPMMRGPRVARREDIAVDTAADHEARRYAPRRAARPEPPRPPDPAAVPNREAARLLEDDVRELLGRLSADLQEKPQERPQAPNLRVAATGRRSAPPLHPAPVGSGDRAAALYAWRGRKR